MPGPEYFSDREIGFLRALVTEEVDFMIVGLAGAALQGAPVVTQGIDLWFRDLTDPGIKRALRKVAGAWVPSIGLNPPMFAGEGVTLFDIVISMHGLGAFEEEIGHALTIRLEGVPVRVLSLERIITSKRATNREKDQLVLPVLEDVQRIIASDSGSGIDGGDDQARSSDSGGR